LILSQRTRLKVPTVGQKDKDDVWLVCDAVYFSREASILLDESSTAIIRVEWSYSSTTKLMETVSSYTDIAEMSYNTALQARKSTLT
jgi:hypothetical protein